MASQLGTVQTVIVCVQASEGVRGSCPEGHVQSVTQAYLVAPSEAAHFDLMAEPFSPAVAGAYFAFALVSTITFWGLVHGAGEVIHFIRKA